jgi:hypothetical protein
VAKSNLQSGAYENRRTVVNFRSRKVWRKTGRERANFGPRPVPRSAEVRERRPSLWGFIAHSQAPENFVRERTGGASGIRNHGTVSSLDEGFTNIKHRAA